MMYKIVAPILS